MSNLKTNLSTDLKTFWDNKEWSLIASRSHNRTTETTSLSKVTIPTTMELHLMAKRARKWLNLNSVRLHQYVRVHITLMELDSFQWEHLEDQPIETKLLPLLLDIHSTHRIQQVLALSIWRKHTKSWKKKFKKSNRSCIRASARMKVRVSYKQAASMQLNSSPTTETDDIFKINVHKK